MSRHLEAWYPVICLATSLATAATARAQAAPAAPPAIVTSASAEVEMKPDRATIVLSVESRAATASKAGAETARKQRAILDTLRALTLTPDHITTARLELTPEMAYPGQGQPPRVTGYVARSSVRLEVTDLDQIGSLIDASLAKEATGIGALQFGSSKAEEGRLKALELAVARAKAEAGVMATAANGTLGTLIELSANHAQPQFEQPSVVSFASARMADAQAPMPVAPGMLKISATVNARWIFTPH